MRADGGTARRWMAAAIVLAIALPACSGGEGSDGAAKPEPKATTTTTEPAPEPGTRLDGADLPAPLSNLVVVDDLVLYYAPDDESHLQLVAVDPEEARVAWTHPAAMPYTSENEVLDLSATEEGDGAVVLLRDETASGGFRMAAVDADGSTRWDIPIDTPADVPEPCGDRFCVDTSKGPVVADVQTGASELAPELIGRTVGVSDDWVLRRESHPVELGGDQFVARPRFDEHSTWRRTADELIGIPDVYEAYGAVFGDVWVVGATADEEPDVTSYPHRFGPSTMAGFATRDGAPLWRRVGDGPCRAPVSDDLPVTCGIDYTMASEDADLEERVTSLALLDPATGADRVRVDLQAYDSREGDRLAVRAPDVLVLRTTTGIQEVDLRKATTTPVPAGSIGWCRPNGHLPEVISLEGEPLKLGTGNQGRPCTVDASPATEEELIAAVVDGTLQPDPVVSTVGIGSWVLWADDGRLEGVVVEG